MLQVAQSATASKMPVSDKGLVDENFPVKSLDKDDLQTLVDVFRTLLDLDLKYGDSKAA